MAGRGKVGEAIVEIVADYAAFVKTAPKKLQAALKSVGANVDFDPLVDQFGKVGTQAAQEYADAYEKETIKQRRRTRATARDSGRNIITNLLRGQNDEVDRRGNVITRLFKSLGSIGAAGFSAGFLGVSKAAGGIFGALKTGGGFFTGIGSDLKKTFSVLGTAATFIGKVAAIPLAIAGIRSLGGAAISLAGNLLLLPGAAAAAGLAIGTVALAFDGFSEAVSAVASGDIKKIEAAFKGLPPAMRAVATEAGKVLVPAFKTIRAKVQQAFFEPLQGDIANLTKKLGPIAEKGLTGLAGILGRLGDVIADKLASPKGQRFLARLFETTERIANQFGPKLITFFGVLGRVFETSLPYVETLFRLLGKGLDKFGEWIDTQTENGSLDDFLLSALETGKDFIAIVVTLFELFKVFFGDTEESGQSFLKDIRTALDVLVQFFKSPDGKAALRALTSLAKAFGTALVIALAVALKILAALYHIYSAAKQAWSIVNQLIGKGTALSSVASGINALARAGAKAFAVGGVVDQPTVALIGEAGREAVIPLTNPTRAKQLMAETGLVNLAAGMTEGGGTTVYVYLGTKQITDVLDVRVEKGLKKAGNDLAQGVR